MKIFFSKYLLKPIEGSQRSGREGALLKIIYPDAEVGYADCNPWPAWGDETLEKQLHLLGQGIPTPLMQRSLEAANLDKEARKHEKSLFTNLHIPPSHYHLSDLLTADLQTFEFFLSLTPSTLKLKVGIDPQRELFVLQQWGPKLAKAGWKLRLDFNERLSQEAFLHYLEELGQLRQSIEFYEDPFLFDPQVWQTIRKAYKIALACDRKSTEALAFPECCDFLVVKPAVQEITPFLQSQRGARLLVFTSYLDHPIGQLFAGYTAAKASQEIGAGVSLCGLLTHKAYEPNAFSEALAIEKNCLIPLKKGFGWGYNTLLEKQAWQPLT